MKSKFVPLEKCIKKQRPEAVEFECVGYDFRRNENVWAAICPSCGLQLIVWYDSDCNNADDFSDNAEAMWHSEFVHHAYIGLNSYCDRCGQKLDWGTYKSKKREKKDGITSLQSER